MERAVAIKKLTQLLGKSVGYRVNTKAPTREEREAARVELPAANEERNKLGEQRRKRHEAILAADTEYQSLVVAYDAAKKHANDLLGVMHHYKFTVGRTEGPFFVVKAEGDSWEDVIEKVSTKERR